MLNLESCTKLIQDHTMLTAQTHTHRICTVCALELKHQRWKHYWSLNLSSLTNHSEHEVISICKWIAFAAAWSENVNLSLDHTSGHITYHDIIAFNQKLGVKGPWNLKRLCNFPGGNFDLKAAKRRTYIQKKYEVVFQSFITYEM